MFLKSKKKKKKEFHQENRHILDIRSRGVINKEFCVFKK